MVAFQNNMNHFIWNNIVSLQIKVAFDSVEIQDLHGYLLSPFLMTKQNRDLINIRFILEQWLPYFQHRRLCRKLQIQVTIQNSEIILEVWKW